MGFVYHNDGVLTQSGFTREIVMRNKTNTLLPHLLSKKKPLSKFDPPLLEQSGRDCYERCRLIVIKEQLSDDDTCFDRLTQADLVSQ
ncbi:hypothetical protein amrb99_24160 [Actinomadura sp. RB99]|nr:hypothetical protein [Actinomadura sp. RB99]